ncbi:hypothetical protein AwWohl_02460 [Gammaproteobacteria bacterium]|nr:hypothetical protein AwWohl_02460 [Gammaproteobacteria bacterium]
MAQKIITQEIVAQVAQDLLNEGTEPSSNNIQKRVGGGSFTTVKRYLDIWRHQQSVPKMIALEIPAELEEKGFELVKTLWNIAMLNAQKDLSAARNEAKAEVGAIKEELFEAMNEIARLELNEVEQGNHIEQLQNQYREIELAFAELNANSKYQEAQLQELKQIQKEDKEAYAKITSETNMINNQLSDAISETTRLQLSHDEQAHLIEQQKIDLIETKQILMTTQAQAQHAIELEKRLLETQLELTETRKLATEKAVNAGKLLGEVEALRVQVRELMSALTSHQIKPILEK